VFVDNLEKDFTPDSLRIILTYLLVKI